LTNAQGLPSLGRAEFHYARPKPAGRFRVVVLGGSTVFGRGVPVPSESLPARLSTRLQGAEVLNAGVPGYTSGQELVYLATELLSYEPDLVITYDGVNDQHSLRLLWRLDPDELNSAKSDSHYAIEQRVNASYTVAGALGVAAGVVRGTIIELADQIATLHFLGRVLVRFAPPPHAAPVAPYDRRVIDAYERNLRGVVAISRAHGIKVMLALQPALGIDDKPLTAEERTNLDTLPSGELSQRRAFYEDARRLFQRLGEDHASISGVCVGDLSRAFSGTSTRVYSSTVHLNVTGNDLIAEALMRHLRRCGLVAAP
jgi:lysophospholipase L1-like esterase